MLEGVGSHFSIPVNSTSDHSRRVACTRLESCVVIQAQGQPCIALRGSILPTASHFESRPNSSKACP
ncbi:hypothetical protein VNO77_44425 [Canavalia gladiata]|uniref:Uncharacterized protein n=1 Tax=Canavalia gladiata TaxID=3824 RepID=A0AAN9PQR5_CANGL